jgi:hypothetical protein
MPQSHHRNLVAQNCPYKVSEMRHYDLEAYKRHRKRDLSNEGRLERSVDNIVPIEKI